MMDYAASIQYQRVTDRRMEKESNKP